MAHPDAEVRRIYSSLGICARNPDIHGHREEGLRAELAYAIARYRIKQALSVKPELTEEQRRELSRQVWSADPSM